MDLKEIGWEGMEWIRLASDVSQRRTVLKTMIFRFQESGDLLGWLSKCQICKIPYKIGLLSQVHS
jgi:hypothetical protein